MGRVDLGRRRLLRNVARGPVLVLLVLGFIRVSAVATLPPRPEADFADHAGARESGVLAFVLWAVIDHRGWRLCSMAWSGRRPLFVRRGRALALPADAELMAQVAQGGRQAPDASTDESSGRALPETALPLSSYP